MGKKKTRSTEPRPIPDLLVMPVSTARDLQHGLRRQLPQGDGG